MPWNVRVVQSGERRCKDVTAMVEITSPPRSDLATIKKPGGLLSRRQGRRQLEVLQPAQTPRRVPQLRLQRPILPKLTDAMPMLCQSLRVLAQA
mmetsp:Transcript_53006/g.109531  ORF Transcript_53006/g.109531 Transcript_53006/m.109531 type:complete len:94 (-) Transcript_53006:141-422(-)